MLESENQQKAFEKLRFTTQVISNTGSVCCSMCKKMFAKPTKTVVQGDSAHLKVGLARLLGSLHSLGHAQSSSFDGVDCVVLLLALCLVLLLETLHKSFEISLCLCDGVVLLLDELVQFISRHGLVLGDSR